MTSARVTKRKDKAPRAFIWAVYAEEQFISAFLNYWNNLYLPALIQIYHSIEVYLKALLYSKGYSVKKLKDKFGHNIRKLCKACEKEYPGWRNRSKHWINLFKKYPPSTFFNARYPFHEHINSYVFYSQAIKGCRIASGKVELSFTQHDLEKFEEIFYWCQRTFREKTDLENKWKHRLPLDRLPSYTDAVQDALEKGSLGIESKSRAREKIRRHDT